MAKKISLDRQTELKKINLKDPDMEKKLREECDSMRDAGYDLKAAFEAEATLVLIFQ